MNFIFNPRQPSQDFVPSYKDSFLTFSAEGLFYQIKRNSPQTLYENATINFSSTRDEFTYNLNIHNDGQTKGRRGADKENILSEFMFRISDRLNFTTYERSRSDGVTTFEWLSDNGTAYGFEFRNKKKDLLAAKTFRELTCKLIYQTKYKSYTTHKTPPLHYLCFCQEKEESLSQPRGFGLTIKENNLNNYSAEKLSYQEPVTRREKMDVEHTFSLRKAQPEPESQAPVEEKLSFFESFPTVSIQENNICQNADENEFVYSKAGDLYQLDDTYQFIKMQDNAIFCVRHLEETSYQLEIYDGKSILLYLQVIEDDTSYTFDFEGEIFKWVDLQNELLRVFGFKFFDDAKEQLKRLQELLSSTSSVQRSGQRSVPVWETSHKKDGFASFHNSAVKENLLMRYEEENEVDENVEDGGFVEEKEEYMEREESEESDCLEEEMIRYQKVYRYFEPQKNNKYSNNVISQSKMLNRVFVSRGPVVSVFKAGDSLDYICDLPHLNALDNSVIYPKKILFYHDDAKMLILNQSTDKKIYSLDLERGLITNEWVLDGYNNILDIEHLERNGELSGSDLFVGINNKNVFQFDPHQQVAPISVKNYTSNPKFSCFTTTAQGNFAIGSLTGDIRLFKETGKNAKNLISGGEDPIVAIESSKDGSLLVATTDYYIMIYRTTLDGANGYLTSLKKLKPQPIKLSLPLELIEKYGLGSMKFSKAKLDNVYEKGEQFIMTTVGKILVVWKLADIMENINDPKIFEFKSAILDCDFRADREDAIVVVLEDEVNYILV